MPALLLLLLFGDLVADRVARGEDEHLIYYILQARTFTARPPVEPAVAVEAGGVTPAVRARMRDFLAALESASLRDERVAWWREHLPRSRRTEAGLVDAFGEAASFLGSFGPEAYRRRGHSSDTSLAAGYVVWHALGTIRGIDPKARLHRVLLVGPGLDWAPRTGLRDDRPPRSYQPFLLSRTLLEMGLSTPERLAIACVDINPRVLAFLKRSPLVELPSETGNAEYAEWLSRLGRTVEMPEAVFRRMRGLPLDITAARLPEQFDLVIATNVLVYFDTPELARVMENVAAMLRSGGYFIHNEVRPELHHPELPPVQARTVEIAKGAKAPLYDSVVIHRRR